MWLGEQDTILTTAGKQKQQNSQHRQTLKLDYLIHEMLVLCLKFPLKALKPCTSFIRVLQCDGGGLVFKP